MRQRLAELHIEAELLRLIRLRTVTARIKGEPPGAEASIRKILADEHGQRIMGLAKDLAGAGGMLSTERPARSGVRHVALRLPVRPGPHRRRRHRRGAAQHRRRARARPPARSRACGSTPGFHPAHAPPGQTVAHARPRSRSTSAATRRCAPTSTCPACPPARRARCSRRPGVTWIRYRVLFENGVERPARRPPPREAQGVHPDRPAGRRRGRRTPPMPRPMPATAAATAVAADNAFGVPAHLLERSKKARERLARLSADRPPPTHQGDHHAAVHAAQLRRRREGGRRPGQGDGGGRPRHRLGGRGLQLRRRQHHGLPRRRHRDGARSPRASCRSTPARRRCWP